MAYKANDCKNERHSFASAINVILGVIYMYKNFVLCQCIGNTTFTTQSM